MTQRAEGQAHTVHLRDGKPVRVCHITTVDMSLYLLLRNQLRAIQECGYEVCTISSDGPYVAKLEALGIRHVPVSMFRTISPLQDLVSLWKLYRVIRKEGFTIVHTHNPKPGLLGQLAAKFAGVPVIVNTVHGFYFHDHMKAWQRKFYISLEKLAALCSDSILSQNKDDIACALTEKIATPDLIKHLGNGIDLELFDPTRFTHQETAKKRSDLGIAPDAPVVGFVGRLAKRKGFHHFLEAARLIRKDIPNVIFLIVGEKDEGKIDAIDPLELSGSGLESSCIFLGMIANDELPLIYTLMNVMTLPSPFEGMPRAVMEATAMQVPVVVSNVKGNRDVVTEGENGLLVPFANTQALSMSVMEVLQNPERAQQMGELGRKIALERFNEQEVFSRVISEYQDLLQRRNLS